MIINRANDPKRKAYKNRDSKIEYLNNADITGDPDLNSLHEDHKKHGIIWSEFGPNHPERTHMIQANHTAARIDWPVEELNKLANIGDPTPVSGDNLTKLGNKRYHERSLINMGHQNDIPLYNPNVEHAPEDLDDMPPKKLPKDLVGGYKQTARHFARIQATRAENFHDSLHKMNNTTCDRSLTSACSQEKEE